MYLFRSDTAVRIVETHRNAEWLSDEDAPLSSIHTNFTLSILRH